MTTSRGFSVASGIFFQTTEALDAVDVKIRNDWNDSFVLAPLQSGDGGHSWTLGDPHPIKVQFRENEGSLAPANTLAVLPLQGRPLFENTVYVAWVRRGLGSLKWTARSGSRDAAAGDAVRPLRPRAFLGKEHVPAIGALLGKGAEGRVHIAAMTVFRTGTPHGGTARPVCADRGSSTLRPLCAQKDSRRLLRL